MGRTELLDKLDRVTDRAASFAIRSGIPIRLNKKSILICNLFIEKNKLGMYDIMTSDKKPLFCNITVFDVAVIIAQRYNNGEFAVIKQVLHLQDRFTKHRTDMVHYLNCLKSAQARNDSERMAILEDKFQVSEMFARRLRDRISIFKRTK